MIWKWPYDRPSLGLSAKIALASHRGKGKTSKQQELEKNISIADVEPSRYSSLMLNLSEEMCGALMVSIINDEDLRMVDNTLL